jgi:hypothetical protein
MIRDDVKPSKVEEFRGVRVLVKFMLVLTNPMF